MAGTQSVKSPLARVIVFVICLAVFGSIVASVHYFTIDQPAQKTPPSPKNTDDIAALQVEIQNLQGQLSGLNEQVLIKTEQMQKLYEQIEFVNTQMMGPDPVKDWQRSEYEQQILKYSTQLNILQIEVQNLHSKIANLENLLYHLQKGLDELQRQERYYG